MTMTPTAPALNKVDHLRDFIRSHLVPGTEVTLIARSSESPVVRALDALQSEFAAARIGVRIVFLQSASRWPASASEALSVDVRVALNPRLLEAHEQLVVGSAVWFGDCMRRDPMKRDAFTQEKVGCNVTSTFAALSFEKLWAIGLPQVGVVLPLGSVPDVSSSRDVAG